jgi:hypothetical protein
VVYIGDYDDDGSTSVSEFRDRELAAGAMLEPGGGQLRGRVLVPHLLGPLRG